MRPLVAIILLLAVPSPVRPGTQPSFREHVNPRDGLTYIWIRPGAYSTGCSPDDNECIGWERPRHSITIDHGFWIGRTEVTQAAFERVTGSNPSRYRGPLLPIEQLDWTSAVHYCAKVGMRLPTESEWEFAAAGGDPAPRYGPVNPISWYDGNSGDTTHPVATQIPNGYGLFDMLGNVWEWTADSANFDSGHRIMKGGSFYNLPRDLRSPNRETPSPACATGT